MTTKARDLAVNDRLADGFLAHGATIIRLAYQQCWVYVVGLRDGQLVRCRYRLDADVKLEG